MKNFLKILLFSIIAIPNLIVSKFGDIGTPVIHVQNYYLDRAFGEEFPAEAAAKVMPPKLATELLKQIDYKPLSGSIENDFLKAIKEKLNLTFYMQILKRPDDKIVIITDRDYDYMFHFVLKRWKKIPAGFEDFEDEMLMGLFGGNGITKDLEKTALGMPIDRFESKKLKMKPRDFIKAKNPTGPWQARDLMMEYALGFKPVAGREILAFWTAAISPVITGPKRDVIVLLNVIVQNDEVAKKIKEVGTSGPVVNGDFSSLITVLDDGAAKLSSKPGDASALKYTSEVLKQMQPFVKKGPTVPKEPKPTLAPIKKYVPSTFKFIFEPNGYRKKVLQFESELKDAESLKLKAEHSKANATYQYAIDLLKDIQKNAYQQIKLSTPFRSFLSEYELYPSGFVEIGDPNSTIPLFDNVINKKIEDIQKNMSTKK